MEPSRHKPLLAVMALFVVLYVLPLGLRPMSAPDEYRYGEIPREMIASGDWVVPRLVGLDYFEKPVLGYWLMGASMVVLGEGPFALRLPSALATGLTAALIYLLLVRSVRDRTAAALAAAALLTALLPYALGTVAILDAAFALFVTGGMIFTFLALEEPGRGRGFLAAAGAAAGLAFLTKGPLGLILPGAALLPYLLWTRTLGPFLRRSWIPALSAVAVAGPWSLAVGLRTEFWYRFLWVEHVVRAMEPGKNQHPEPFYYYVQYLAVTVIPAVFLLPAAIAGLRDGARDGSQRRLRLFAALWLVMPVLFLSISSGKRITYVLPVLPAAVILLVEPALQAVRARGARVLRFPLLATAILGVLVTLALIVVVPRNERIAPAVEANPVPWLVLGAGAVVWTVCGAAGLRSASGISRLALVILAPAPFLLAANGVLDENLMVTATPAMTTILQEEPAVTMLVSDRDAAQAMAWITRRTDVEIFDDAGELEYGLGKDAGRHLMTASELRRAIEDGTRTSVLLALSRWEDFAAELPEPDRLLTGSKIALALYNVDRG